MIARIALDTRTKSKKHIPIGLEQLSDFIHELATTQGMMAPLIDRMLPIYLKEKQALLAKIKQLRQQAREIAAQRSKSNG